MKQLKIYNGFGIKPTNTHQSAGMDFYVPLIDCTDEKTAKIAYEGLKKSYKKTDAEMVQLLKDIRECVVSTVYETHCLNILHLYLAFYDKPLWESQITKENIYVKAPIYMFMQKYIVFDDNNIPGIKMPLNSTLFINSGIKVALEPGTAGIFLNKSGKGNAGFDVRAQVVDEDYAGYVHLSVAFTKDSVVNNIVYCGDKLTQMVILPVIHMDPVEINEDEYNEIMKDSARGADAFGSSDVKH